MGNVQVIQDLIEAKLLDLHTAYVAKVISFDGKRATVQPLAMVKQYGKEAKNQSIVSSIPVVASARYKIVEEMRDCGTSVVNHQLKTTKRPHLKLEPLAAGDVVFCVCADRDISETQNGNAALPAIGHHSLSDSVVMGVLS